MKLRKGNKMCPSLTDKIAFEISRRFQTTKKKKKKKQFRKITARLAATLCRYIRANDHGHTERPITIGSRDSINEICPIYRSSKRKRDHTFTKDYPIYSYSCSIIDRFSLFSFFLISFLPFFLFFSTEIYRRDFVHQHRNN